MVKILMSNENSIKKSNQLSMAKLHQGLTLQQMQLLSYAIYSTQKNGATQFHKYEFEEYFSLEKYNTKDARIDAARLTELKLSVEDLENDHFEFWNIFVGISYKAGLFQFTWSPIMIPHILELQEKYVSTDLKITAQFKSNFSWTLYEFLKAHYGYWHKRISKETLMKLFAVEEKVSYKKNTAHFKIKVLDTAIEEINRYTELKVSYKELKKGRSIIGFDLQWSKGKTVQSATKRQILELKRITDVIFDNLFDFVNLNNHANRERAIEIVKESEEMSLNTNVNDISITLEQADFFIKKAMRNLKELQNFLEQEQKRIPEFYNWLEDRG